jgi:beta-1,4-N-acetylglucosaminyltransferase
VARVVKIFSQSKICGEVILIFLTVGTWRTGYDRLVKAVDELVDNGVISDEVIAQIGNGSYMPKHMTVIKFCSPDKFVEMVSKAGIIISHVGMGTIIEVVRQHKPLIAVPRQKELGEVDDDHQFSTARQLEKEGKMLVAYETKDLPAKLKEAESFVPVGGGGPEGIIRTIQEFINDVIAKKH